MEPLVRACPCGNQAVTARGLARCEDCRTASGRDYQNEYKRRERLRAQMKAGLAPGESVERTCWWCEEQFHYISLGRERTKCDRCKKKSSQALRAEWQKRNPEKHRASKQRHVKSTLGTATVHAYNTEVARFRKYNIDRESYERMLASQGGRCGNPGCGATEPGGRWKSWHIDHDRACCPGARSCGSCVRGLLCEGCNKGLGHFRDDPTRLAGAAEYLAAWARKDA